MLAFPVSYVFVEKHFGITFRVFNVVNANAPA